MPYAVDYRPKNWEEVAGNKGLVRNILELGGKRGEKEMPHAFMFQGASGCGKTTLARLLAIRLGATGRDIREINAGDCRGIDAMRDMIIRDAPFGTLEKKSRAKVYIIDEFHQVTSEGQRALLKPIEEPQPFVYYIYSAAS